MARDQPMPGSFPAPPTFKGKTLGTRLRWALVEVKNIYPKFQLSIDALCSLSYYVVLIRHERHKETTVKIWNEYHFRIKCARNECSDFSNLLYLFCLFFFVVVVVVFQALKSIHYVFNTQQRSYFSVHFYYRPKIQWIVGRCFSLFVVVSRRFSKEMLTRTGLCFHTTP